MFPFLDPKSPLHIFIPSLYHHHLCSLLFPQSLFLYISLSLLKESIYNRREIDGDGKRQEKRQVSEKRHVFM